MKNELPPIIGYVAPEVRSETHELALLAFSSRQKTWIRDRDNNECQFPVVVKPDSYKPCGRTDHLQIHHAIIPQRFGRENGYAPEELDVPENAITLCESHHNGVIHNDMLVAKLAYGKDKTSFAQAFERRGEKLDHGERYWNDEYDTLFERIIKARNGRVDEPFPLTQKQEKRKANGGFRAILSVFDRDKLLK